MNNIFHNKSGKKLARAETSSICRQMFANMLCRSRTQFEFVSTSWSTFVCCVKAARGDLSHFVSSEIQAAQYHIWSAHSGGVYCMFGDVGAANCS